MAYTAPIKNNINFIVTKGYSAPTISGINFILNPTEVPVTPVFTSFEGTVFDGETALSGAVVHLYYRSTGVLVNSTVTSSSGTFSVPWGNTDTYYYMVALFPDSTYNALIYDYLYPTLSGN